MLKKTLVFFGLPIIFALVIFLVTSGIFDLTQISLNNLVYYLPANRHQVVKITSSGFEPKSFTLSAGSTVKFVNVDNSAHWPASNLHPTHTNYSEFDAKKPIEPGKFWEFKIEKTGIWYFHDHLDPSSGGRIKVVTVYGENNSPYSWTKQQGEALMNQIELNQNNPKRLALMRVLAYKVGPEVAIQLLNSSSLTRYGETHLVAHIIGEVAYELYHEKALPFCQNDQLNGCSHGAILTAVSDVGFDGVKKMISYCKTLSAFKNHMCLHAAGHAFTAQADYDVYAAIKMCDSLEGYEQQDMEHCYNGLFMENVLGDHNGLTPPQHPYLSESDLLLPCNKVDEKYQSGCYLNQASWWYRVFKGDIKKTAGQCMQIPEDYQRECADSVGRIISTATLNNLILINTNCNYMKESLADKCKNGIAMSVFALSDENLPFKICSMTSVNGKKECYLDLYSFMKLNDLTQDKISSLCQKIETEYQYVCETKN